MPRYTQAHLPAASWWPLGGVAKHLAGFLMNLIIIPVQTSKSSSDWRPASWPSRARWGQGSVHPQANRSPQLPEPAKTGPAAGLFAKCTAFLPVQGPKPSSGQFVALGPSPARGGPCPTHQRATKSPQPPQPANVGPGAGIFGKCTAFFSLVLSCQVKNS